MKQAVKKVFLPGLALLLTVCLVFLGTGAAIANTMPSRLPLPGMPSKGKRLC